MEEHQPLCMLIHLFWRGIKEHSHFKPALGFIEPSKCFWCLIIKCSVYDGTDCKKMQCVWWHRLEEKDLCHIRKLFWCILFVFFHIGAIFGALQDILGSRSVSKEYYNQTGRIPDWCCLNNPPLEMMFDVGKSAPPLMKRAFSTEKWCCYPGNYCFWSLPGQRHYIHMHTKKKSYLLYPSQLGRLWFYRTYSA